MFEGMLTCLKGIGYIFLEELIQECKALGVVFEKRSFQNLENVMSLRENVVFNCLGLGSREAFGDTKM
jgi:hypothetical protein